jgi:hypothetical protein
MDHRRDLPQRLTAEGRSGKPEDPHHEQSCRADQLNNSFRYWCTAMFTMKAMKGMKGQAVVQS